MLGVAGWQTGLNLRKAGAMSAGEQLGAGNVIEDEAVRGGLVEQHHVAVIPESDREAFRPVARNLAVDSYRARQARPAELGEAALNLLPSDDDADRTLESWAVADALSALRPDHRQVLVETYYRGCSVAEAAATLGIPPGTVKSRTFYALKALKLALQERGLAP